MYTCVYMYIQASFIKDGETLFIIFNCNFSSLLVMFLMSVFKRKRYK